MGDIEVNSWHEMLYAIQDTDRASMRQELNGILRLLDSLEIDITDERDFRAILLEYIDLPEGVRTEKKSVRDFKRWLSERGIVLEL